MQRRTTWLLGLSLALGFGCTADNPNFRPSIQFDAAVGDQHVSSDAHDLGDVVSDPDMTATMNDLAKPPPDLYQPQCSGDTRFCNDNKIIACENEKYVVERYCPQGSSCKDASCQAPMNNVLPGMQGSLCENDAGPNENICLGTLALGLSCQPFLANSGTNSDLVWRCAGAIGAGTPATPCTNGATCRTGFCGDNGTCFRSCNDDNDCPAAPVQLECKTVGIVVEGHNVSAKSCVPTT